MGEMVGVNDFIPEMEWESLIVYSDEYCELKGQHLGDGQGAVHVVDGTTRNYVKDSTCHTIKFSISYWQTMHAAAGWYMTGGS